MKNKLSNQTYIGCKDFLPEDMKLQMFVFRTWRKVCEEFGFAEYLTPVIERAEIFEAKSGEDAGSKELFKFTDKGGRELALRPEMTPGVTRMVSKFYKSAPKPIKLFSIANFFRYERPQRGRSREFWQLNVDIFGDESINSDVEILRLAAELMLIFNPPEDSFVIKISSRKLMDDLFDLVRIDQENEKLKTQVARIMDKFNKLTSEKFSDRLQSLGLNSSQIDEISNFLRSDLDSFGTKFPELVKKESFKEIVTIFQKLSEYGYDRLVKFSPEMVRGFDYYNGIVFEVFDLSPENNRSMFGGGRYNGLGELFGIKKMPATGFAPGDQPMKLFLESWGLKKII